MIPYGRQDISEADVEAVVAVLRSDFLTQGPAVPRFEAAVAAKCGATHAVAVSSATSALHLACMALDVGVGDTVWTSPITFVASANCALYCGATVDFVDIDPLTCNMSMDRLAEKLAVARQTGRLPKVVIPVHLAGQVCDMTRLHALGVEYGFHIIEDASHAIGGKYRGEPVGNCAFSDITVFSFHPVKIITTAEGGMLLTNQAELAARLTRLRTHGITRDPAQMHDVSPPGWYYEQLDLGYNYRLTDVQAALGLSQLNRLDQFVVRRHEIAVRYDLALRDVPVRTVRQIPESYSGLHLYIVRVDLDAVPSGQRAVFDYMRAAGIAVNLHYIPVYRQPYYARMGFNPESFPAAEQYYAEAITLPMYPALSESEQDYVVRALAEACRQ
jgi:UDP-4-amino-4,6-dideoxy-N-acetyl-beta-L-altrosamine transaminase